MLRSQLKKLTGKEDPETTAEEDEAEEAGTEVKNIKMVNYIRNQFIARGGWIGSISMSRGSLISEAEYSVDIGAEDVAVTEPPFAYDNEGEASTPLVKMTKKLLDSLEKKANAWRNVPYKSGASISISMSIPLGPFSIGLAISAEVESILISSADKKQKRILAETSAL